MIDVFELDRRPIVVAIAGPNGAGKTTFFHVHLAAAGLQFVNADATSTAHTAYFKYIISGTDSGAVAFTLQ